MDEAGVGGAMHPPASWDPGFNEQAVRAALAAARFAFSATLAQSG
jgi:hypothetical protein